MIDDLDLMVDGFFRVDSHKSGSPSKTPTHEKADSSEISEDLAADFAADNLDRSDLDALERTGFKELIRRPPPGSLLKRFLSCSKKVDVERVLSKFLKEDLLSSFFNPDIVILPYVVFRLVLPHPSALHLSETFRASLPDDFSDSVMMERLSSVLGEKIENRADFKKIFFKIQSYHPRISGLVQDFFGTLTTTKVV